jgi:hypothetical protein
MNLAGAGCRNRTRDLLITKHSASARFQGLADPRCVKPATGDQRLTRGLSNLLAGPFAQKEAAALIGGQRGGKCFGDTEKVWRQDTRRAASTASLAIVPRPDVR